MGDVRVLVVAALVLVAGCSATLNAPQPTVTVTQAQPSTSQPGHGGINDQDRVFFAHIQDDPYFKNVRRDSLIESAHIFCDRAARGPDEKAAALQDLLDVGMPLEHAVNLASAAAYAYCPQELTGIQ